MANRSSAGVTGRSCFCHGSLATTTSIRSRPSAVRHGLGHLHVTPVDRVERAAEEPDAPARPRSPQVPARAATTGAKASISASWTTT